MKKIILAIAMVLSALNIQGQITELPNGFVGIGTNLPITKLDITNGTYQTYFTGNALTFKNSNVASYIDKRDAGSLRFRMGANLNTAMTIDSNLRVGIGTVTPDEKLDVNGNIISTGTLSLGAVASSTALRDVVSLYGNRLGATNMYGFGVEGDGTLYNKAVNNHRWYLSTNADLGSSAKMELTDSELLVNAGVEASSFNVIATDYSTRLTSNILQFSREGLSYIDNNKSNGSIAIRTGGTSNVDMIIRQDGNVGIGTTNTQGFKLGVDGKIAATEVKVATYTNWPDYVFTNEYELPTLKEVENHIKEKGHLQNIPSAEEVKKDGFFLGEMDAKLLQKVEELTLYTIQQEKSLVAQEKKLTQQNKEIQELKVLVTKLIKSQK